VPRDALTWIGRDGGCYYALIVTVSDGGCYCALIVIVSDGGCYCALIVIVTLAVTVH